MNIFESATPESSVEAPDWTKGIKSVFVNKCAQGLGGPPGFRKASLVLLSA
eukprot:COSAG02_NODE_49949_length_323_cov_1.312500_1_plen_50_part_10